MIPLSTILRSTVFAGVLSASAAFVVLSLAVIWTVGPLRITLIENAEAALIEEALDFALDLHEDEGPDALMAAFAWEEDQPIWDDDDIFVILEDEDFLFTVRNDDGATLAGYEGLWGDTDLQVTALDHPEIDRPVLVQALWFDDGTSIAVGRFLPERIFVIQDFIGLATFALIIIVLPLALITGFFLSRGVFRRLETLSRTSETVASGRLDARAPLDGSGDEFDRLGAGINTMLDQVEALTRNVEAVSIGVAHDLKTPLANIGGRLELIRRDIDDPAAVSTHLDVAEDRLQGLLRVFDALLRMGEISSGRRRGGFAAVDLTALCLEMADTFAPLFEDADKTLSHEIAADVSVHGDRDLLAQMIANLLENAIEHARDAAQVTMSLTASQTGILLTIADDGPGVAPGLSDRVFERFYRADASRGSPGNGLGLALVKSIVDLHGASITLRSDTPGAVFEIRFGQGYEIV